MVEGYVLDFDCSPLPNPPPRGAQGRGFTPSPACGGRLGWGSANEKAKRAVNYINRD